MATTTIPITAKSAVLSGTPEQRATEERTMYLRVKDNKAEVTFTGFWNGHFVRGAIRDIMRRYKLYKLDAMRASVIDRRNTERGISNG